MTVAVAINHLKKSYGSTPAVKDVSFNINQGEIFGLLGPNGAGKTTTIRCLTTLTKPDSGTISVGGVSAIEQPKQARRKLGYVAQEVAIDKVLTGKELLELQADLYHLPKDFAQKRIAQLAAVLGLQDYQHQKTGTYSGGIRKRLDLAAGLLHQPQVLVLDEPTVGLDIESRRAVWEFLRQIKASGTTVLITSHYLEEIDILADRLAIIDSGHIIAEGTPTELKQQVGGDRVTLRLREFTPIDEAHQAQQILQSLPSIESVIINSNQGNSLNLISKDQTQPLSMIEAAIVDANLPIFSLAQSRPSLDDVYLQATGKTIIDAEIAAMGSRDLKKEKKQQMKE